MENNMIHIFVPKPLREGQVCFKMHHRDFEISMSLDDSAGSSDHLWRGDVRIYDRRVLEASHSSNPSKADVTIEFYGHNQGGETTLQGLIGAVGRINAYYDRGEKYPFFADNEPASDEEDEEEMSDGMREYAGDNPDEMSDGALEAQGTLGVAKCRYSFVLDDGSCVSVMIHDLTNLSEEFKSRCNLIYNCAGTYYVKKPKRGSDPFAHEELVTFDLLDQAAFERFVKSKTDAVASTAVQNRFVFALSNGTSFAVMLPNMQYASSALLRQCDFIYNCATQTYVKDRGEDRVYWRPEMTHEQFLKFPEMEYGEFVHRRNTGNWKK